MSLETPLKLRMLQRKLYQKAKEEPNYRFYLLYDKMYREDLLAHAYALAKSNQGAPGVDGQSFRDIESRGLEEWLSGVRGELRAKTYQPQAVRRVMIPKPGGGERPLRDLRRFGIGWCKQPPSCCWNQSLKRTSIRMPTAIGRRGAREKRSRKCTSYSVKATPMCGGRRSVEVLRFHSPHSELVQCVARRIVDRDILRLIKMWLKVPVQERDEKWEAAGQRWEGQHLWNPTGRRHQSLAYRQPV